MTEMTPYDAHQAWLADYRARHAASLEQFRVQLEIVRARRWEANLPPSNRTVPVRPAVSTSDQSASVSLAEPA